jgi:4-hydroxybenzoate polyprenyltransferase
MSKDKQEWIGSAFVGIGLGAMALFGALAAASATLGPIAVPIWAIAAFMVISIIRSPMGKAFADRLAGRAVDAHDSELPALYAEVDELRTRLAEMEERQDFAERMLAQPQPARTPGQGS